MPNCYYFHVTLFYYYFCWSFPICSRVDEDGHLSTAYPARRIVQLAQAFGDHSAVQSICSNDLGLAVDAVIDLIARHQRERAAL